MDYNTLVAAKGTTGSLQSWVNYSKLDSVTVLSEAQALLFSILRCREMQTQLRFTMPVASSAFPLPTGFLDPVGRMMALSINLTFAHKDQSFVVTNRNYTESTGTLASNAMTTVNGSPLVTINLPNHGLCQEGVFYVTGTAPFNGVTIVGTFNISSITDVNNFVIDITPLGTLPNANGAGGGAAMIYQVDNLNLGSPFYWAVWDETIHWDQAFFQQMLIELNYYKSPTQLSSSNNTNWLTNRYPHLLREACLVSAADFMKHDSDYQRHMNKLQMIVGQVNVENDMQFRGMELDTETP